jgi:hypothetical protein
MRENAIMTPQERALVADLFDRLAKLESEPRDPEAEQLIRDGLARAPHALYPLVQTVLLQDEALKQAEARIQALEDGGQQTPREGGSFLDTMRDTFLGRRDEQPRGSVPNVRPGGSPFGVPPGYQNQGGFPQAAPQQTAGGGSFLGTAAAAAAGMIGGSLLMNSLGGMFGGHHNSGAASAAGLDSGSRTPWDSGNTNNDMSRDLGINDIGRSSSADAGGDTRSAGLFDTASNDDSNLDDSGDFDLGGDTDIG